ncbi:MAG: hypothetical protein ACLFTJ_11730, partial [Halothece sp.]
MDEKRKQKYLNFIQQTFKTFQEEEDQLYSLLVQHEELLTLELGEVLSEFVRTSQIPKKELGDYLLKFGKLLQGFTGGYPEINRELAITCYQNALSIL